MNPILTIPQHRSERGFTVIELLVTIAIIFVLLTIAMVALRTARRSGERTISLNALKQMTMAYNGYANEHGGRLLPGYIHPNNIGTAANQISLKARLRSGFDLTAGDTAPYVWRLAPYLDHEWSTYMTDYRDKELLARLDNEYGQGDATGIYGPGSAAAMPGELGIARVPSFGLNSIYLGGDNVHGDEALSPWDIGGGVQNNPDTIAAVRLSNVKSPAKIIVFGAALQIVGIPHDLPDPASAYEYGYFELRPPFANFDPVAQTGLDPQWIVESAAGPNQGQAILTAGATTPAGLPVSRLGDDHAPISHLDGSTEVESIGRLSADMSRWAPNAISGQ